ncbi:tRNA (adenosine(37)-N6)-threonylcarbamoyltransferase complex transferase subunit TsaD [Brumimicrobium mesophilum]|uniref:tRNA (adenosine(37)-N6)-threonylcarbamoyltransferase complex transferase subunit TsaD n=1 Tax=Brumimicrobium mesophilum TaxID=392717 RepID=UPI000D143663|nr:tRNA (adenosine(37)-N6)-threonylcarbamoyltransferase complex transferase subunit TsaD [Brumimicrobium mesophilum]
MSKKDIIILGIESSCDDTSAAIIKNETILSNEIAGQKVHEAYGGVVPELASRAHQQNILPVVDTAIKNAKIELKDIDAIAFTRGPGLLGSLIVGTSFAKSLALGLDIPIIEVNHMHGHVLAHFIDELENDELKEKPSFPFICLTVSGGHTQIVLVRDYLDMEVVGTTKDDAAGEAFDKTAKLLGLPYPGGPLIDKYAKLGNPEKFKFTKPEMADFNYSFSGLKTNVLQFLQRETKKDKDFVENNLNDICASLQKTIIDILFDKLIKATRHFDIHEVAIAGGVSANSGIRQRLSEEGKKMKWKTYIPKFEYCTDNAAMIAITGRFHYLNGTFAEQNISPMARLKI